MFDQENQQIANGIISATAAVTAAVGSVKAFPIVMGNLVKLGWDAKEAAELTEIMIGNYRNRKTVVA